MSVYLQGCRFEDTELSIHFEPFNDESAIVKEAQGQTFCVRNQTNPC